MKKSAKMAFVGGYLGSGKTTLLINVGKKLISERGKRVAIITNDQGEVLVDTETAKDAGLAATEVVHGCFCCRFPDFIDSAGDIMEEIEPDIILAEPVGSCMDVSATVIGPIQAYYQDEFSLAPFIVLVDASAIPKISEELDLLSPTDPEGYLISGQIHEAEIIAINKIDLVSSETVNEVQRLVRKINSRAEILTVSAKTGAGVDEVVETILGKKHQPYSFTDVDYDVYTEAETELGWLNSSWMITAEQNFRPKEVVEDLLLGISQYIEENGGKVAHLKLHFVAEACKGKASLVRPEQGVDFLSLTGEPELPKRGYFTLNARAKINPEDLAEGARRFLESVCSKYSLQYNDLEAEYFSPDPPRPHYRVPEG